MRRADDLGYVRTGQLDHVNLILLNEAIYSGFWYFDCDENSEIVNANWSHEFRKCLAHDTLDFPNKLESLVRSSASTG